MSDNQRRLVCRMVFLLLCAAPTSVVGYWICHPQTTAQWETQILAQLGVEANIGHIETPFPYITILRDVELTDPELGPIFEAMEVEVNFEDASIFIRDTDRLTNAGIVRLMDSLNSNLIRRHAVKRWWRVMFENETVIEESIISARTNSQFPESLIVKNLYFNINSQADFTGAEMKFQLADQESEAENTDSEREVRGRLVRSHNVEYSTSRQEFEINTWGLEVPCWLLAGVVPQLDAFGIDCKFTGKANVVPREGSPSITLRGKFTHIDPSVVGQPGFTHPTSGQYSVVVNDFQANNAAAGQDQFEIDGFLIDPRGGKKTIPRLELAAGNQNIDIKRTARNTNQNNGSQYR